MQERYTYEQIKKALEGYKSSAGDPIQRQYLSDLLIYLSPLIKKKARYYFGRVSEDCWEDLIQDGYLRSIELIEAFDLQRGTRFLGYMQRMLGCFFFDKKKAAAKMKNQCSFQEEYMDVQEDQNFSVVELRDLFQMLSTKETHIVCAHILQGRKLIQVAKELHISYVYAKELKRNALHKLRKSFCSAEEGFGSIFQRAYKEK